MQLNNEDERFRKYYDMRSKGVSHNVALEQSKYKHQDITVRQCSDKDSNGVMCEMLEGHKGPHQCPVRLAAFRRSRGY